MPLFEANMRVVYHECWYVEAKDADEARKKFSDLTDDVQTDEAGEVTDWECYAVTLSDDVVL